jgi:hypothetical protein
MFTTAVVSVVPPVGVVALSFTGRKYAAENLEQLLSLRDPPILMSDASSRNAPDGHDVIEATCIPHGRRQIGDDAGLITNSITCYRTTAQHLSINRQDEDGGDDLVAIRLPRRSLAPFAPSPSASRGFCKPATPACRWRLATHVLPKSPEIPAERRWPETWSAPSA